MSAPRLHRRRWIFGGYALLLLTLTHLPPRSLHRIPFQFWDVGEHTLAYLVLSFLALWSTPDYVPARGGRRIVRWIAALILFAAFDEATQPLVARAASLDDWAADCLGVVAGAALWILWSRRRAVIESGKPE